MKLMTTNEAETNRDQRQHARDKRDEETGQPVAIVPDGEKENADGDRATPDDSLKIDPESRIPRPVQPDLA